MFTRRFLNLLHGRLALINLEVCALQLASFCRETKEDISSYDWRRCDGRHTGALTQGDSRWLEVKKKQTTSRPPKITLKLNPKKSIDFDLAARDEKSEETGVNEFKTEETVTQLDFYHNVNNVVGTVLFATELRIQTLIIPNYIWAGQHNSLASISNCKTRA